MTKENVTQGGILSKNIIVINDHDVRASLTGRWVLPLFAIQASALIAQQCSRNYELYAIAPMVVPTN